MKLKTRLLSMLLVTSLIPLLIFSVVSVLSFVSKSRNDIYKLNEDKLEIAKAEIDKMLEKNFNSLQIIAGQDAIRNFDLNNAKKILTDAVKVNPDLVIALDNANGDQLVKSNDDDLTNVSDRDFFQQAINGNEKYVSDVILARTTGKLMVVIATPVRDMNDNIVGVLQANIQLSKVSDFVTELSKNGSSIYVLSRQKTVLAHPNIDYVQNQEDFSHLKFAQTENNGQNSTIRTKNINGESVIVSYCLDELPGWLIVVETPVRTAMLPAYILINVSVAMFLIACIIVFILSRIFSKSFTKPLVELSSIIKAVANGELKDFDVKVESNDEIGQLYYSCKVMTKNLRELVGNIQTVSMALASHSLQLSKATEETTQSLTQVVTTINEMAQGNSEQAMMIQGTTDAINKANSIVSNATVKTESAATKAEKTLDLAKAGQMAIEKQSEKIEENNRYTKSVGESIQQLAAMADEIRNIVGVINGIAGQTNLLSLNASIEAARAGEAGRGFAVVAEEIRKLAEQSSNSTKKIEEIVNSINSKIDETVKNMNKVKESVNVMESSAAETNESFDKIFTSVTELAQLARDVYASFEQINNQTREVADQATGISAVVEEAAASMQEISASSEEQLASMETISQSSGQLEAMAKELLAQVEKFKVQ